MRKCGDMNLQLVGKRERKGDQLKMIKRAEELVTRTQAQPSLTDREPFPARELLKVPEEMYNKGALLWPYHVMPGSGIGYHVTEKESETTIF